MPMTPDKLMEAAKMGFARLRNFRRSRLLFLRSYVGQYYDREYGEIGTEPLNQIFAAISVLVPNLVMSRPEHVVTSQYMAYRSYGELLGLALDLSAETTGLKDTLRRWIVDSLFTIGILKTGLADSSSVVSFDETDAIDTGTVYTELCDLDDFTFDPTTNRIESGTFVGHRVRGVPRVQLLDSGLYDNALVERLPRSGSDRELGSRGLTRGRLTHDQISNLDDEVDITELWVPAANALVAIPGTDAITTDFLRVSEYYGPDEGPFTYLRMTQPVPNNPMPVAAVGIWQDLHIQGNRMVSKIMSQAMRQKDILAYRRAAADDAQEVLDAVDGEAVAVDDPEGVKTLSFGGQQRSNEAHIAQLQMWFNYVSGNIEALGGIKSDAASATQANILQANGAVRLEDMDDIVYDAVASEAKKRAWYFHTDPLIELPLIQRAQVAAQFSAAGELVAPATMEDQQVVLTPEARRGDFLDFAFKIKPRSMSRHNPAQRLQRAMEFGIKLIPAAAVATQTMMMMGVPFSFQKYITRMAKEAGIEWMDEVFYDPEFQMQMAQQMMQAPGIAGSQGQMGGQMGGIRQNGQPGNVAQVKAPTLNREAQQGANEGQASLPARDTF